MTKSRYRYSVNRGYHYPIANRRLISPVYRLSSVLPDLLRMLEDRRVFHPLRDVRPALSVSRRDQSRTVASSLATKSIFDHRLGFAVPHKVLVCVRRQQRREVMIARGGAGSHAPKRRNEWSDVSCERR